MTRLMKAQGDGHEIQAVDLVDRDVRSGAGTGCPVLGTVTRGIQVYAIWCV